MNKTDILKAIEELSPEDQQAVRTAISESAAASCCNPDEMQQHMATMMKMMQSSEQPMDCCEKMMGMCKEMMQQPSAGTPR